MLRLTGLRLTNFGPFKGEQSIDFPQEDGVTIIYGENMRGKTSLLNAIRFAFFGRILGRGRRDAALHKVGNWEEAAENKVYGFEVALDMTHAGARYRLVRTFRPGPASRSPPMMAIMSRITSWSAMASFGRKAPTLWPQCCAAMRDRRARCIRSRGTVHAARGIALSLLAPWASSFSISSDVIRTASFNASSMWT